MADDKDGREKQARNADNRQREREVTAALERGDETEPPVETDGLDAVEMALDGLSFPATGAEVVAAVGDQTVETAEATHTVDELVPETEAVTFETPPAVRQRVARPTVAAAMTQVVEASTDLSNVSLGRSQHNAYEKTFRTLAAIDADDDDEGIAVITDWIVERIEDGTLPGSRAVRRQAAKFCRANGYAVRDDEWLGV